MVISWSSKGLHKGNMVFLCFSNQPVYSIYIYICLFTGQISPISSDIHTSVGNVHGIKHLHCCDCILIPTSSRAIRRLTYSSMHTHTCVVGFEFRYYFWTYRALGITLTKCLDQVVPIPNPSIDHESSVFIAVFEAQSLHVVPSGKLT